jgi:D-sedoheptulose 7-phosphate isomerase
MRNSCKILRRAIVAATQTLQSLFDLDAQVAKAANLIEESLRAGNKLLVCGNGGSAADASHFATEFVVRFTKDLQLTRRSVFAAMAGYSLLRATIMVSMRFSLAR